MMKEFFKKNWKLISIIGAAAVAVIVTVVVLCVCLIPGGKSKLATPENVKVVETTLTWDEVENAENGYTVKIGDDETTTVDTHSLDLTTVTAKLKDGENKLSVKANATEAYDASDYSAEVTYTYDATPAFDKLATPTIEGRLISWTAVDGATSGYTVKVGDKEYTVDKNLLDLNTKLSDLEDGETYKVSVKVNATAAHKASEYSATEDYEHKLTAQEAADVFKAAVDAIDETVTVESEAKIAVARAKYDKLSPESKALATEAIATLAEKECDYFAAFVEAIDIDNLENKKITVAENEAVDAAIKAANGYYKNLIDNTDAEDAKGDLDTIERMYEELLESIQTDVDKIAKDIEDLELTGEITLTGEELVEYYETLLIVKEDVDGLGEYAATLLNSELVTALETEIAEVLKVPYKSEDSVETFLNGATGTVTILYKAVNLNGEAITGDNTPELTVTLDEGSIDGVDTSNAKFSGKDGVFYYTVGFTVKPNIKDAVIEDGVVKEPAIPPQYRLKVTYTIGNGEEQEITYVDFKDDLWFWDGDSTPFYAFHTVEGVSQILLGGAANGSDTLYFDIYESKSIDRGTNVPVITGFPLISGVPVSNHMTEEAFRKMLARDKEYSKLLLDETYEVRFVVYNKTVAQDNGITMSNIKTSLVSANVYTLNLTEDDAKERIHLGGAGTVIGEDGKVTIGAAWTTADYDDNGVMKPGLVSQFNDSKITADNVHEQLKYKVGVSLDGGEEKFFYVDCVWGGSISANAMKSNIFKLFGNSCLGEHSYVFSLTLMLRDAESEYSAILRESETRTFSTWGSVEEGNLRPIKLTLTLPDNKPLITIQDTTFIVGFRDGLDSVFDFGVDYVELSITKGTESYTVYFIPDFNAPRNNSFELYITSTTDLTAYEGGLSNGDNRGEAEGKIVHCDYISNCWFFVSTFNNWMKNNTDADDNFNVLDGWVLKTRVHFDADYGVTSDWSDDITYNG